MGRKRITLSEIKDRLLKTHGGRVSILDETFTGNILSKAIFSDNILGLWEGRVSSVLSGCRHPKHVRKSRIVPIEEIKRRLFLVHGEMVSIVEETYIHTHKKATFIHKEEGAWEAYVYNVLGGLSHTKFRPKILTQKQIEDRLKKVHGDRISIIWDSFINTSSKAKFIDRHGEFEALVNNILNGQGSDADRMFKTVDTCKRKYGCNSHTQNREMAAKMAKAQIGVSDRLHWKTGEELVCQGSYEPKVVDYLNSNKIDYLWQPQVFQTSILTPKGNKSTYRPDLFLVNENKWIEIKGFFRKDALEKWDWFKSEYPNSELWDRKKLKEMGIL